jgi:hypothetical protein
MSFIVRIVGLDDEGKGIWYPSEEKAKEYAEQATANGWQAVITPGHCQRVAGRNHP